MQDSAGNFTPILAVGDSVYFFIFSASGAATYKDSSLWNGAKIVKQTYRAGTTREKYVWKQIVPGVLSVSDTYTWMIIVCDNTGAALETVTTGMFQLNAGASGGLDTKLANIDAAVSTRSTYVVALDSVTVDASNFASRLGIIAAGNFVAGAIDASAIAADAIGASELAASAIGSSELATGSITTLTFASGAIDNGAMNVTENLNTNVVSISASAAAADSLEFMFTGTGNGPTMYLDQMQILAATGHDTAVVIKGAATAAGMGQFLGGGAGAGVGQRIVGGATGGDAMQLVALAGNGNALTLTGQGSGLDLNATLNLNDLVGTLDAAEIGTGAITAAKFAADAIDAAAIAADAIGASEVAANAIGSAELAAGAITNAKFAVGAIDSVVVAAEAIGSSELNGLAAKEIADSTDRVETTAHGSGSWQSAASSLDSGVVSRIIGRKVWAIAAGSGSDSSTIAQREATIRAIVDGSIVAADFATGAISSSVFAADADMWNVAYGTAFTAGSMGDSINGVTKWSGSIVADSTATDRLIVKKGVVSNTTTPTTTTFSAAALTEADNYWSNGNSVFMVNGAAAGQVSNISAFANTNDLVTHTATSIAPAVGDSFYITAISSQASGGGGSSNWSNAQRDSVLRNMEDAALTATKIGAAAITAAKFAAGAVDANAIATDAIGAAELAASAVGSSELATGAITNLTFAAGAIDAAAIATDAIGAAEVATDAIGASELAASAIGSSEIAAGAITSSQIAASAIGSSQLAAGTITAAKFGAGAIDAAAIAADAIGAAELAGDAAKEVADTTDRVITTAHGAGAYGAGGGSNWTNAQRDSVLRNMEDLALTANKIAANAITSAKVAADAIGATQIAASAITSAKFAAGAIDSAAIAASAIGASELAASAIGASEIASGAITNATLAAGTISAGTFAAGAVDVNAIGAGAITATTFAANAITATSIANDAIGANEIATSGAQELTDSINNRIQTWGAREDSLLATLQTSRLVALHQGACPSAYDSAKVIMYPGAWTPNKDSLVVFTYNGGAATRRTSNAFRWNYYIVGSDSTAVADTIVLRK